MKKSFLNELKTAIQIALLKHKDMHSVAGDKNKTKYAFYIIILWAVVVLIGQQLFMGSFSPTIGMGIATAIFQIVMAIIGIYVLSVIAKSIFKGQAKHDAFFRVMAYAMIVGFISIIPMLSFIGGIWGLVLVFVILKTVHKLTTGGAIGTIVVGIVVLGLISMLISPIFAKFGVGYQLRGSYNIKGYGGGQGVLDVVDEDNFEMTIPTEDGTGNVKMEDGTMTITGPDGETMEINISQ